MKGWLWMLSHLYFKINNTKEFNKLVKYSRNMRLAAIKWDYNHYICVYVVIHVTCYIIV